MAERQLAGVLRHLRRMVGPQDGGDVQDDQLLDRFAAQRDEALRMIEKETREIQLLLTDVIMPLMNGRELATRLRSLRPETKVLYMSGYTEEVLAFHGIAHPEISFIQKPFTNPELAAKIELALTR